MEPTIWLMAVLSFWTFCHRLYHTWIALQEAGVPPALPQANPVKAAEKAEKKEGQRLQLGPDPI
jgi:hypothetical protein